MTMAIRFRVVPAAVLILLGCGDNAIQSGDAPLLGGQATVTAGVRSIRGLNQTKPLNQFTLSSWSGRNGLPQNSVQVIHQSANGYIWIGTQEGLVRFNGSEFRVFDRASNPDMRNNHITALIESDSNRLWVGTYGGGLFCLSTDGAGLFRVVNDRLVPLAGDPPLPSGAVRALHVDGNGDLWVGTYGGLSVLRQGGFLTYATEDGLVHNQVRTMIESADGTLWIGTYGGGMSRFDGESFVNYTTREGLHNDALYQILEDETGDLWMSTNTGIFRVSRADLDAFATGARDRFESVVFDETDGMAMRECNGGYPGGHRSSGDGRLWFPTMAGVAVVDVRASSTRPPSPVAIERFAVDNEEQTLGQTHVLSPGSRRLEFAFAALSFVAPRKTRFRYRLDGFDRAWVAAGNDRIAQYTRLRPGHYVFNVEASFGDGAWTGQERGVEFTLRPAVYQTAWFFAVCVLAIAALVYGAFRRRVYAIRKNERALTKRVDDAVAQIHVMQGLLPICSYCKKIRDDTGYWNQLEGYIREHSEVEFSHSYCPDCLRKHLPEFADDEDETQPQLH